MALPAGPDVRDDQDVSLTRRAETANPYSPVMIVISLLALLGILAYAKFLLTPSNRGDFLPYAMVIAAELVLVFHALAAMWTILSGRRSPQTFAFYEAQRTMFDPEANERAGMTDQPHRWPIAIRGREVEVDVLITVYGEALAKIRATATAAMAMTGAHRTWILDDGRSEEVKALATELGCFYVRRLSSNGAKAGNINHALSIAKGDFFCVFDADFVPEQDFLVETVPFFVDDHVAFVQTPQTYGNLQSLVARGAGYMQTIFYKFVQPGRNHFNAAFCVGTNVIFRRTAIDEVGGIYTDSKSEDVWTSLKLHEAGWRSIYISKTLAVGDAPESIEAYAKQQLRWATGGFEILLTHNPLSPRRRKHLTMDQRLMYFVTATHYLTGIAPGLLLLVPALEIYFDLRPVNLDITWTTWLLFYAGFYLMQILLAFYTLGSFRWEVLMLAAVSFPIYTQAFLNAFAGKEQKWHVTGSKTRADSPFNFIVPQVLTFVFLALTSVVAIWRDVDNSQLTIATVWNLINTVILATFLTVALREDWRIKHPAAGPKRASTASEAPRRLTTVVVPPALEEKLGMKEPDPSPPRRQLAGVGASPDHS